VRAARLGLARFAGWGGGILLFASLPVLVFFDGETRVAVCVGVWSAWILQVGLYRMQLRSPVEGTSFLKWWVVGVLLRMALVLGGGVGLSLWPGVAIGIALPALMGAVVVLLALEVWALSIHMGPPGRVGAKDAGIDDRVEDR